MTTPEPEPLAPLDRLFDEALTLPPEARIAFLEAACPDDTELLEEVRALVEADAAASHFFDGLFRSWVSPLRSSGVSLGTGSEPGPDLHLAPGSRVARYEIVDVLGAGGMGVVYRARDPVLERDVALKLLPPHALGDGAARAGLQAEARRVARLDHPHVGVIHEVGETDDAGVYLAMACHEGETLADRLRRGPLPLSPGELLRVGRGVASALEAAHRAGIVHRDVKPSNVLLTAEGGLRLVDFGIAAAVGEAVLPRGSRGYTSPEVLQGAPADHRTDLWSLGVLLHEMATGVRPPSPAEGLPSGAERPSSPAKRPSGPAERPSGPGPELPALDALEEAGTLPGGLVRAIRACLDPDPLQRPGSAAAVAALLEESPSGAAPREELALPWVASPPPPPSWTMVGLGALGVALLAAGLAFLPGWGGVDRGGGEVAGAAAGGSEGGAWAGEASAPVGANLWGEAHRVLVLPLEDRTGDPALAMVGKMAADWISEGIARAAIANVVDGGAALAAAREARDPVEAASIYHAGLVVTGAYYLEGDSLRLSARIVDGTSGTLLRGLDPVVAPREDPLAGIEPLRQVALTAVALHLDPLTTRHELLVIQQPPPWEAYLALVRGKDLFLDLRMAEAREAFSLAEALDPGFHLALFYGAIAAANLGDWPDLEARRERLAPHFGQMSRPTRLGLDFIDAILAGDHVASYRTHRRGVDDGILAPGTMGHAQLVQDAAALGRFEEAVSVAREADPMRGEVRRWLTYWSSLALALHALGDFEAELETARRARAALGPLRSESLSLELRALSALGDLDGVEAVVEEALQRHPNPAIFLRWAGDYLLIHGHEAEGIRRYREGVARARADRSRDPDPDRDWILAEGLLALAAALSPASGVQAPEPRTPGTPSPDTGSPNDTEVEALAREAVELFASLRTLNPGFIDPPTGLGRAAALLGDTAEARRWADHLAGVEPRGRFGNHHYRRARIAALLGDPVGMVEALEAAYRQGFRTQFVLRDDPLLHRHRDHPAMAALLHPR